MIQDNTIISVHVPKTAGSSFLHQLKNLYGVSSVLLDYEDDPVAKYKSFESLLRSFDNFSPLDPSVRVVHGHFNPVKYSFVENAFRLTFLRHPIENIISIFKFWSSHELGSLANPLFHYFKSNKLGIREFALLDEIRYLYSRVYFRGVDLDRFDFVGDYNNYSLELMRLSSILKINLDINVRLNVTSDISSRIMLDPITEDIEKFLHEILEDDISFYFKYAGKV